MIHRTCDRCAVIIPPGNGYTLTAQTELGKGMVQPWVRDLCFACFSLLADDWMEQVVNA